MPAATAPAPKKSAGIDTARSNRPPSVGKTVKLRAKALGQYGRPIAILIKPGEVFSMAVSDLERKEDALKAAALIKKEDQRASREEWINGRETKDVGGVAYLLPSWTEDAAKPVVVDEDDVTEVAESPDRNDDVI